MDIKPQIQILRTEAHPIRRGAVSHLLNILQGYLSVPITVIADLFIWLKNNLSKWNEESEDGGAVPESRRKKKKKEQHNNQNVEVCGPSTDLLTALKRIWLSISKRWREKLEKLVNTDESKVIIIENIMYIIDAKYRIPWGSDGTEVFLGLKSDGTEVAIKRMSKTNYQVLMNEKSILRLPKLYDSRVVRYIDFKEDDTYGYLCLQLCEYTLEEYIKNNIGSLDKKKLIYDILDTLKDLHCQGPHILHGDLKPQNVLIDVNGRARLANFGNSLCLPKDEDEDDVRYKLSGDIQDAGMLIYYILSGGHHPFGVTCEQVNNIQNGNYKLDHVQDLVAKDLIEEMINKEPQKRPKVEECLNHPFFWTNFKKLEYLRRVGNRKEVADRQTNPELLSLIERLAVGVSFSQWKEKFPPHMVEKVDDKKKPYPNNIFGLLRFNRNIQEHYSEYTGTVDPVSLFPDLFGYIFKFTKDKGWDLEPGTLKEMLTADVARGATQDAMPLTNSEDEHVKVSVQESQSSFTQPTADPTKNILGDAAL